MNDKIQSPHPALQALLPRILQKTDGWKPVFPTLEEAQFFVERFREREGRELFVKPVWAIEHADLTESRVVGWTVAEEVA